MKQPKSLLIISLALAALVVVGVGGFTADNAPASGCGQSCGSSCGTPTPAKPAAVELNLTPAQKQKIADIEKERDAKLDQLYVRLEAKDGLVSKLIADSKASRESIKKAVYEMSNAQADIMLTKIFSQREKEALYTPAQKAIASKAAGKCACGCGSK